MTRDAELKQVSGTFTTSDPIVVFLYLLLKDCVCPKQIECILESLSAIKSGPIILNNGWIAQYAENIKDSISSFKIKDENTKVNNVWDKIGANTSKENLERIKSDALKFSRSIK